MVSKTRRRLDPDALFDEVFRAKKRENYVNHDIHPVSNTEYDLTIVFREDE